MLDRHKIPQHFTASAVVIERGHILLVHHKRIGAWVPPGGHLEPYEMPHEACVREVFEETGLAVEVLSDPVPETGNKDAFFLKNPLGLHSVKAIEKGEACYHLDLIYLCRPLINKAVQLLPNGLPAPSSSDVSDVSKARWFNLDELEPVELALNVTEAIELAKLKLRDFAR
jgi:ADP-ribose pyrophosphatase YjhB (NUDIX family)